MVELDQFISQLRRALAYMDDPPRLENHPLAELLPAHQGDVGGSRGQALRRALRSGIAALDPDNNRSAHALEARSYQVLFGYAITKRGMEAIAASLGISRRQAYRELRIAIEALAKVLFDLYPRLSAQSLHDGQGGLRSADLRQELERLSRVSEQIVDLGELISDVVANVKRLASDGGVVIQYTSEISGLPVSVNRVMMRQALLNLLSHVVSACQQRLVHVSLSQAKAFAQVDITYSTPQSQTSTQTGEPYAVAERFLTALGVEEVSESDGEGRTHIRVQLPLSPKRRLLIVDDNEGLISLFRSYVRHQPYVVYEAHDYQEALRMIGAVQPEIVILDVIMPNRDGWEVLEALRATEAGQRIRIIVCSIINDPQLSAALGADAFLNKPVRRVDLLQALESVAPCSM